MVRKLKRVYAPFLNYALQHRARVLIVALLVTVPALVLALYIGSDFMPKLDEGAFLIQTVLPPDTSLDEVDQVNHRVEDLLRTFPEVQDVVRRTSRAERSEVSAFTGGCLPKRSQEVALSSCLRMNFLIGSNRA